MIERSLNITHDIQVGHRLSLTPGLCQNIHGHSMEVTLCLFGDTVDENGMLFGDFRDAKKRFRAHLDKEYDHRLLLNADDPLTKLEFGLPNYAVENYYPGVRLVEGDPTTENIAEWIGEWAWEMFPNPHTILVSVRETKVNALTWMRSRKNVIDPALLERLAHPTTIVGDNCT